MGVGGGPDRAGKARSTAAVRWEMVNAVAVQRLFTGVSALALGCGSVRAMRLRELWRSRGDARRSRVRRCWMLDPRQGERCRAASATWWSRGWRSVAPASGPRLRPIWPAAIDKYPSRVCRSRHLLQLKQHQMPGSHRCLFPVLADSKGFVVLPKRWVVERSHGTDDRLLSVSEAWVWLTGARIARRLVLVIGMAAPGRHGTLVPAVRGGGGTA